jgi:hypothetical protein
MFLEVSESICDQIVQKAINGHYSNRILCYVIIPSRTYVECILTDEINLVGVLFRRIFYS